MCGIFAIIDRNLNLSDNQKIEALNTFQHRGPDNTSFLNIGDVFLGHHRLSIRDLTSNSDQPKYSQDKNHIISYNGEIYNSDYLNKRLIEKNIKISKNKSDTEILINFIANFGVKETLKSIRGMFAFIHYDLIDQKVYLARDAFGEKPLYIYNKDFNFIITSDLKSIHHIGLDLDISKKNLDIFFRLSYIPGSESIYKNVNKILPGQCLIIDLKKDREISDCEKYIYFNPDSYSHQNTYIDKNSIKEALIESVNIQLVSDVEIGTLLSGGIDSSLITALAAKINPKITSYTIGFNNKKYDESKFAKEISDYLGVKNYTFSVTENDLLASLDFMSDIYSEPFADSSQIPTYALMKFCKNKIKVALTGDGGDEFFGGYNRYIFYEKYKNFLFLPNYLKKTLFSILKILPILNQQERLKVEKKLFSIYDHKSYYINMIDQAGVSNYPTLEKKNTIFDLIESNKDMEPISYLQLNDVKTYLPDDILVKTDRASMFFGIETRSPFLDKNIYKLAISLNKSQKLGGGHSGKLILQQILSEYLPKEIFNRPKTGFGVPMSSWIKNELKGFFLNSISNTNLDHLINKEFFENTFIDHINEKKDNSHLLWNFIIFQKWYEKYH